MCVCVYSQSISIIFTHIQYRPMIDIDKKFGDCQAIPGHPLLSKEHRQHLHSLQIQHLITNPHTAKGLHQNLHFSHASATESERRRLCWVGFPALIDVVCFHSERSSSNLCKPWLLDQILWPHVNPPMWPMSHPHVSSVQAFGLKGFHHAGQWVLAALRGENNMAHVAWSIKGLAVSLRLHIFDCAHQRTC